MITERDILRCAGAMLRQHDGLAQQQAMDCARRHGLDGNAECQQIWTRVAEAIDRYRDELLSVA